MSKKLFSLLLFLSTSIALIAQTPISGIINHYTAVTDIDYCESILTVDNPDDFQIGQEVLLIQMQGATINESNSAPFGDVTNMNSAGLHERSSIVNIVGNQIYFQYLLVNFYETFGSLQLVSVPVYENAQLTGALYPQPWDGMTGGVLAFEVEGTLTVDFPIDASGSGFRGGVAESIEDNNCFWALQQNDYYYDDNNWRGAPKGEGIAQFITDKIAGKGAQANGGGGANDHNSGGGGGGHLTAGGDGGENDEPSNFGCNGFHPGVGGKAITENTNRYFMGGGGGAGHMNNDVGTDGAAGGGIIMIKANTITSNDLMMFDASGGHAEDTGGADGGGGGGAGGSIFLEVTGTVLNPIVFNVMGGNGSTVDNGNQERCMGPGGGGSGGVVSANFSSTPSYSLVVNGGAAGITTNSTDGCNNSSMGATMGEDGGFIMWDTLVTGFEEVLPTVITQQPLATLFCEGTGPWINIWAEGNGVEFQWQIDEGSGFVNLTDGPLYAGTSTDQISLFNLSEAQDGFILRCVVSSNCFADVISDEVELMIASYLIPDFTYTVNGTTVEFTNASSGDIDTQTWEFGDGNSSSDLNPTYEYMMAGTYQVNLIIENACFTDTITQEVVVGALPTANFELDNGNGCTPHTVQFTDLSDGDVVSWNWSFPGGEPAVSDQPNPTVVYNDAGVFDVSLAVTNAVGSNSVTMVDVVTIEPTPDVDFSIDANGLTVTFNNLSTDATTYQWNFGDGSDFIFDENPTYTYTQPGVYEVTLLANNEFCGSGITITIEVMTSGVDELGLDGLEIYPVPFKDYLVLNFNANVTNLELVLYDLAGVLLLQKNLNTISTYQLNVAELPAGTYQLRLKNDQGVWTRKVVKIY